MWYGVLKFLKKAPVDEASKFLYSTLPHIIDMALKIEDVDKAEYVLFNNSQNGNNDTIGFCL